MTLAFAFGFLFLLSDFLRVEGSLNERTVGLDVDVLMAGRAVYVSTLVTIDVFETHLQFETVWTFASMKTDAELCGVDGFSRPVFGTMGFKKVSIEVMVTSGGFETALVGMKKVGTLFLETCTALTIFGLTTVTSFVVIGFEEVGTHVTGPEKPRETGDDIIGAFLVEQNELFGEGPPLTFDVVGAVCVDQKDLVVVEGWIGTELGQLFVPTRTWRDVCFLVE